MGVANGINTIMRTLGGVVGGQFAAVLIEGRVLAGTHVLAERGFTTAFWAAAAGGVAAAGLATIVTPLSRRREQAVPEALGALGPQR